MTTPSPEGTSVPVNWRPYTNSGPCKVGELGSGGKRETCRLQADVVAAVGKDNDYSIDCDVTLGDGPPTAIDTEWESGKSNPRVEITSGGPGSSDHLCCGITFGINIRDGTLHMEAEDWSMGHSSYNPYCDDGSGHTPCSAKPGKNNSISGGAELFHKTVHIHWEVRRDSSGGVHYGGWASMVGGGKVVSRWIDNPKSRGSGGQVIFPGSNFGGGQQAEDPTRIRTDSVVPVDYHSGPTVTLLGKNTYGPGIAPGGGGDIISG